MRLLFTLVLAVAASVVAAMLVSILLERWARADQGYILVVFAVGIAIAIVAVVFLVASAGGASTRRVDITGAVLAAVCAVVTGLLALNVLAYGLDPTWFRRELRLVVVIGASLLAVVAAQWLAFRLSASIASALPPAASEPETRP